MLLRHARPIQPAVTWARFSRNTGKAHREGNDWYGGEANIFENDNMNLPTLSSVHADGLAARHGSHVQQRSDGERVQDRVRFSVEHPAALAPRWRERVVRAFCGRLRTALDRKLSSQSGIPPFLCQPIGRRALRRGLGIGGGGWQRVGRRAEESRVHFYVGDRYYIRKTCKARRFIERWVGTMR